MATAVAKKKSPQTKTLHPPYFQMISEAISSLKDRTGSSQPAIAKFIEDKYQQVPPNFKKMLSVQLKKFVKSERLVKVKNSYKMSATEKSKLVAAPAQVPRKKKDEKEAIVARISAPKKVAAKKLVEKAVKMKRLSQVKTPEALKKKSLPSNGKKSGGRVRKLGKTKNNEAKKKKEATKQAKN